MSSKHLYRWIVQNKTVYKVNEMCKALNVSESGYYQHIKRPQIRKRDLLLVRIKSIYEQRPENDNYGVQRIYMALLQAGYNVSPSTVYRTMKENGLVKKNKRHPNGITREDQSAQKSENIIKRDFTADAPNKKWLTDITEVPCFDGKLYVAPVLDCFNGEIVGLAIDNNMRKKLCIDAFESACKAQKAKGMILHSDKGSQYTSKAFRESLKTYEAKQSMSGVGRCYDNARMESFFATLKKEKLYRMRTERYTMEKVKSIIFRYIMIYYNKYRIYTSNIGGYPPSVYKDRFLATSIAA